MVFLITRKIKIIISKLIFNSKKIIILKYFLVISKHDRKLIYTDQIFILSMKKKDHISHEEIFYIFIKNSSQHVNFKTTRLGFLPILDFKLNCVRITLI